MSCGKDPHCIKHTHHSAAWESWVSRRAWHSVPWPTQCASLRCEDWQLRPPACTEGALWSGNWGGWRAVACGSKTCQSHPSQLKPGDKGDSHPRCDPLPIIEYDITVLLTTNYSFGDPLPTLSDETTLDDLLLTLCTCSEGSLDDPLPIIIRYGHGVTTPDDALPNITTVRLTSYISCAGIGRMLTDMWCHRPCCTTLPRVATVAPLPSLGSAGKVRRKEGASLEREEINSYIKYCNW